MCTTAEGPTAFACLPQRTLGLGQPIAYRSHRVPQWRFAQQLRDLGWQHQAASRPSTAARGFVPVAKRWVVECTFAWLSCFRRVIIDYEHAPDSHAAWL